VVARCTGGWASRSEVSSPFGGEAHNRLAGASRTLHQRMDLAEIVADFALALKEADALRPQAVSFRSGKAYQPGIGPHGENSAVQLVVIQMQRLRPGSYESVHPVPYPGSRQQCDIGIGDPLEWVIEVKMARAFGDNGKLDDTYLKDLLSPYESDHSALSDATKLRESGFACRKAI
jgi:hypothetical protein